MKEMKIIKRSGQEVVFDKENYHIGDRVMVEISDSSSATLLGKPI